MTRIPGSAFFTALTSLLLVSVAHGQSFLATAITYQGQLTEAGRPLNGQADFVFTLWDADVAGNLLESNLRYDLPVANGLFQASLDFGDAAFHGTARWVQIAVRNPAGNPGRPWVTLQPRQRITAAPFALALPGVRTEPNGACPNVIAGWQDNAVTPGAVGATIGGGGDPDGGGTPRPNRVTDDYGAVGGGGGNRAGDDDATTGNATYATVGGGYLCTAGGSFSTVGGGWYNFANAERATVGGGWNNKANSHAATVGGGRDNEASGWGATVPGGTDNRAHGECSFAAGCRAKTDHDGTWVWADSTEVDFASTAANQFLIRASGGVGIGTPAPKTALDVAGMARVNGATWPSAGEGMELGYDSTLNRGYIQAYDRDHSTWGSLYLGNGNVGIGTSAPPSKLTVAGTIESTSGGVKYPDGTTQTTATVAGPAGPAGYHCWDLNMNRVNDPIEDMNHDGAYNIIDCQGAQGAQGPIGPPGPPTSTSAICMGAAQLPSAGYCDQMICTGTVVAEVRSLECSVTSDTGSCSSPSNFSYGVCCVCAP